MLRTQTVETGTLDLIKKLMSDSNFNEFNLVGGTALALQIGHRISIDIDLFSIKPFNASELSHHLMTTYHATEVRTLTNGVFCFVNNIKMDMISHQYPLVEKVETVDGIRIWIRRKCKNSGRLYGTHWIWRTTLPGIPA